MTHVGSEFAAGSNGGDQGSTDASPGAQLGSALAAPPAAAGDGSSDATDSVGSSASSAYRAMQRMMLLFFDKNHDGKIDAADVTADAGGGTARARAAARWRCRRIHPGAVRCLSPPRSRRQRSRRLNRPMRRASPRASWRCAAGGSASRSRSMRRRRVDADLLGRRHSLNIPPEIAKSQGTEIGSANGALHPSPGRRPGKWAQTSMGPEGGGRNVALGFGRPSGLTTCIGRTPRALPWAGNWAAPLALATVCVRGTRRTGWRGPVPTPSASARSSPSAAPRCACRARRGRRVRGWRGRRTPRARAAWAPAPSG